MSLTAKQKSSFLETLKSRFEKNKVRHNDMDWLKIQSKLENQSQKLASLYEMEISGGEPDVVDFDKKTNEYIFFDCAAESPKGRRSLCYDHEALESRKEHKPKHNAVDMANKMGIELLDESQYRYLQKLGVFDTKTSSWLKTPKEIRKLGGAVFGDNRYKTVFIYHNSAQSYYGSRGFRGCLRV